MRNGLLRTLGLAVFTAGFLPLVAPVQADPLATAGIGVQSCEKLAKQMNPAEGFDNMANALVFYWVQGYLSAANMALLEGDSQYVDLSHMDEKKILPLIFDYCTRNPGKKPISVLDKLIDETDKVEGKWKSGTIPWAADE